MNTLKKETVTGRQEEFENLEQALSIKSGVELVSVGALAAVLLILGSVGLLEAVSKLSNN